MDSTQQAVTLTVFLVEDSLAIRARLAETIRSIDGTRLVGEAGTVGAAIAGIRSSHPGAVILDLQLEDGSGLDVLKDVRAIEKEKNIPAAKAVSIIMCSAFKEPFVEAYKFGCNDYMMKPIDPVALLVMVTRAVTPR